MFNHENRFRCTIIRGKAQSDVEDLAPSYAQIIQSLDGVDADVFSIKFNEQLAVLVSSPTKKTLDNHRTEIAGKLFGMYYFEQGKLVVSKRTIKLIETGDLTYFFKTIVQKFQFPNCMDSKNTLNDKINNKIKLKPFHFILKLLELSKQKNIILTKREIAFYVLDSLDVLQGEVSPDEIVNVIVRDREQGAYYNVEYPNKASSYSMQHISEQLNLLELADCIVQTTNSNEKEIQLNYDGTGFVSYLSNSIYNELDFDVYRLNESNLDVNLLWAKYYCADIDEEWLNKSIVSSQDESCLGTLGERYNSPIEIGDIGEKLVFEKEKERVKNFNPRLAQHKVLLLGKQRGLGFDIQSVWAGLAELNGKSPDSSIYIEVKTTKRITKPSVNLRDKIILTRNEFLAAEEKTNAFAIFRVYLTREGVFVSKIFNPLSNENSFCSPIKYNYEFSLNGEVSQW